MPAATRRAWLQRLLQAAAGLTLEPLIGAPAMAAPSNQATPAAHATQTRPPHGATPPAAQGTTPRPAALHFPHDHGAHPAERTEWWYVTGWLAAGDAPAPALPTSEPRWGFQLTFFRSRTSVDPAHPSAFAAKQLILAHVALSDPAGGRLQHDQRIARAGFGLAEAAVGDTQVQLRDWSLQRDPASGHYRADIRSTTAGFGFELTLQPTQPLLLQGDAGWSRKGPQPQHASHYVSEPQLRVRGRLDLPGARSPQPVHGRAWLDHEWSESLLAPDAVGWDWIGMNLTDGSALTAFRLRRADGSTLWAGGSWRGAPGTATSVTTPASSGQPPASRSFTPDEVHFTPLRHWRSPATGVTYPVEWQVDTPAGPHRVRALLDAQELDSRASTGTVYWEGLSELLDAAGRRIGLGYLELTGYGEAIRL